MSIYTNTPPLNSSPRHGDPVESYPSAGANLSGAVAALPCQVLVVSQHTGGPGALDWQAGVDEGGGAAVVIYKERLHTEMEHS